MNPSSFWRPSSSCWPVVVFVVVGPFFLFSPPPPPPRPTYYNFLFLSCLSFFPRLPPLSSTYGRCWPAAEGGSTEESEEAGKENPFSNKRPSPPPLPSCCCSAEAPKIKLFPPPLILRP